MDGRCSRGPVPAEKGIDTGQILRQGRLSFLVAHEAAQFIAVGQAPVVKTCILLIVKVGDVLKRFLPGAGEDVDVGILQPAESGQVIENRVFAKFKSSSRPGKS